MTYSTLIDTATLEALLGDPGLAIVDCRFRLDDVSWGEREYAAGHIPGAVYAHLDRDLAGPKTGSNGRHPLPDSQALAKTVGSFGIDAGTQVVAYDQDAGMYASRLWWLLRWLGHTRAAVLDGGWPLWTAEARPIVAGVERREPRNFIGAPRRIAVDVSEVSRSLHRPDLQLVDARSPERFRGENETLDRAAGHIPGAANHFFRWNVDDSGRFLPSDALRARFTATLGATPPEQVVCYCGSGVTACHNLLAMEHAGLTGAKLFAGSWSEWSSDPSRPIEEGDGAE